MEAFDRFLDLPDDVLYHTISFMTAKEIGRLSTTSVRCLRLCLTNPSLTVNPKQDFEPIITNPQRYNLYTYLNKCLDYRSFYKIPLLRFRILSSFLPKDSPFFRNEMCLVVNLICKAFKLHVQHLHFNLQWPGDLKPCLLPLSSSLKSLDFTLNGGVLELPFHDPPLVFNSLESLTIKSAQIAITDHGNIGEFFSQSCRRVKKLFLSHLWGFTNLSITSERLERLEFHTCCWESYHYPDHLRQINISTPNLKALLLTWLTLSPDNRSTNIYAPNLELLQWNCFSPHWNVGPFNSLRNVNINLLPIPFSPVAFDFSRLFRCIPVAFDFSRLFRCIQSVKILTVHSLIMEIVLLQERCDESFKLDNAEELNIVLSGLRKDMLLVPAVAAFLGRTPNLKVLRISYYSFDKTPGYNVSLGLQRLRIQMPRHSFPQGIKAIRMKRQGGENEEALTAYLVENAHWLEKINVPKSGLYMFM